MIDFATDRPLQDAVDRLGNKTPIGAMLSSREWELTPLELRDRAFWMARVEEERILAAAQRRIMQAIRQERDGSDRLMDRGRFVVEMQAILRDLGYRPDPAKRGGVQDLSSSMRLTQVWRMNLDMAQNYAAWKSRQNDVSLLRAPAQELIRVESRIERRLWSKIWYDNGGLFYGAPGPDYPDAPGRMIALVTDPIWRKISRFNVPWPPYDWGSGMGLRSIRRREALTLSTKDGRRLLRESDAPQKPISVPFNSGLKSSVKGVPEPGRERLRSDFGDAIRFDGDTISYQRDTTEANEHREEIIREELRDRARSVFDRGQAALESGGRQRLAEGSSGVDFPASAERELLVSGAAVEVGRKALYHDQYGEQLGEAVAEVMRRALDPRVRVEVIDGHVLAWRPDLTPFSAQQLFELSAGDPPLNGLLLGYGAASFGNIPRTQVVIRDADGSVVFGFHAPFHSARTFGEARLRDWQDATGDDYTLTLIPVEGGAA